LRYPQTVTFKGTMRVISYDPRAGMRLERMPESRFRLWFGLFFSVGLACIGVLLFARTAFENYRASGTLNWLDFLLIGIGLICVAFGLIVALPLALRFVPKVITTTHEPPLVCLRQFRTHTWRPQDVCALRLVGRQYLRRTDPDAPSSWYVFSLVLQKPKGRERLLLQTLPQPDYEAGFQDIVPIATYFSELLATPLTTVCNWDAPAHITRRRT